MSVPRPFDIQEHIFRSPQLQSMLLDAIRFFNGTPVHSLPLSVKFPGSGVYALYYTGPHPAYQKLSALNRTAFRLPIYVGKAVPAGGRKGLRQALETETSLHKRLGEHAKSIGQALAYAQAHDVPNALLPTDFYCRFVLVPGDEAGLIAPIEAALIRQYQPLWNAALDGFGNHDPGNGRYQQARSQWDTLHPGRAWADKCQGVAPNLSDLLADLTEHLTKLAPLTADEVR